ncbi:MAG: hypothetical protein AB7F59_14925 [Bdellovibrionales bacterium]
MKTKLLMGAMMALLYSLPTFAGNERGNGGDAYVCELANGRKIVEVWDYFEGVQTRGLVPELGNSGSYIERAKFALARLRTIDLSAYNQYIQWVNQFTNDMQLADRSIIKEIDDSTELIIPTGNCTKAYKTQFAVQLKNPKDFEKRYVIDEALWSLADETQKAGLLLHEIFYREAINSSPVPKNSDGVRYFNTVVSSKKANELTFVSYGKLLEQSGLINSKVVKHTTLINGLRFYYGSISFHSDGKVSTGELYGSQSRLLKTQPNLFFEHTVKFYENGTLYKGNPADPQMINGHLSRIYSAHYTREEILTSASVISEFNIKPKHLTGQPKLMSAGSLSFFPTGEIKSIHGINSIPVFLNTQPEPIGEVPPQFTVELYESGYPKQIIVNSQTCSSRGTRCLLQIPYQSKPGVSRKVEVTVTHPFQLSIGEEGSLLSLKGVNVGLLTFFVGETKAELQDAVSFYPSGVVKSAFLRTNARFLCNDHKTWKTVKPSRQKEVQFDQNGLLICRY